jgi:hypothetical protein
MLRGITRPTKPRQLEPVVGLGRFIGADAIPDKQTPGKRCFH